MLGPPPPHPLKMIFHFGSSFQSEIFSNDWSWRDILVVKISAGLVTPNLISGRNKSYFCLPEKLAKVLDNTCYRALVRYKGCFISFDPPFCVLSHFYILLHRFFSKENIKELHLNFQVEKNHLIGVGCFMSK